MLHLKGSQSMGISGHCSFEVGTVPVLPRTPHCLEISETPSPEAPTSQKFPTVCPPPTHNSLRISSITLQSCAHYRQYAADMGVAYILLHILHYVTVERCGVSVTDKWCNAMALSSRVSAAILPLYFYRHR